MFDNSQNKLTSKEDRFVKNKAGWFVAWPLCVPPHQYGSWSFITINKLSLNVDFIRALRQEEIDSFCQQPYLWWGVKLVDKPWALVKCRKSLTFGYINTQSTGNNESGSLGGVGV